MEIQRVTSENNKLHTDSIQFIEEAEEKERHYNQLLRKKENECLDLKFLCSQYTQRIGLEQQMSNTLRDQVEKIMKQQVTDQAFKKRKKFEKVVLEVPKIDAETGLEPVEFQPTRAPIMDPLTIDIVKACEKKVEVIEQQRDELNYKCQDLQNEVCLILI